MKYKNYYTYPKYSEGDKSYYGTIDDLPEASMIEADNLEEYERIFHQYVDDHLNKKVPSSAPKRTYKGLLALICVIAIVGIAIISCPDRQSHKEAITAMVNEVITESSTIDEEDADLALLGMSLAQGVSNWVLDGGLTVKNHFVCSIGKFNTGSEEKLVSFGIFGHVFTFGKEALAKNLNELF